MGAPSKSKIADVLQKQGNLLVDEWVAEQLKSARRDLIKESELRDQCGEFVRLLETFLQNGGVAVAQGGGIQESDREEWSELKQLLANISRTRTRQGFSPMDTATFVFSFKAPLFKQLRIAHGQDASGLADDVWNTTVLLDNLGMWTAQVYQKSREDVILGQQQDMLELSTPVVTLWEGILALPVIGTLDSARSQIVMESLLTKIVETGSTIAIIDITGVPTVDTLTAQHLLKTVTAARLMGADCIISGIRPQIAQTIVHLGVDLNAVITKASLAGAFALALERLRLAIVRKHSDKSNTTPQA